MRAFGPATGRRLASFVRPLMPSNLVIDEPMDADVLHTWRWRVGSGASVVLLSRSGDAFFTDQSRAIFWLDTGVGKIESVAKSKSEFFDLLSDPTRRAELLLAPVVDRFVSENGPFPTGRCLGYKTLPIFGASYDGPNRVTFPVTEHFSVTGHIHEQIADLPEGGKVELRVVD